MASIVGVGAAAAAAAAAKNDKGGSGGKGGKGGGKSKKKKKKNRNNNNNNNNNNNTLPKKIAFLFLVREGMNQEQAWREFFQGPGAADCHSIYCHPKHPERVSIDWLKDAVISENVPTKWGDVSVTKAIIALLRAALQGDRRNEKFIICSESCAPLRTFAEVYGEITSHSKSYFDFMSLSDYSRRYAQLLQPSSKPPGKEPPRWQLLPLHCFKKHATWWILDRAHASTIVKMHKKYLPLFKKVTVPDEHFFASVLWAEGHSSEVIAKQTTFVNWDANNNWFLEKHRFCLKWGLNLLQAGSQLPDAHPDSGLFGNLPADARRDFNKIRDIDRRMYDEDLICHPKTYSVGMAEEDIATMLQSGAFFARKFKADTDLLPALKAYRESGKDDRLQIPPLDPSKTALPVPQYLQSQMFEEMQTTLAYLRTTMLEIERRHALEKTKKGGEDAASAPKVEKVKKVQRVLRITPLADLPPPPPFVGEAAAPPPMAQPRLLMSPADLIKSTQM